MAIAGQLLVTGFALALKEKTALSAMSHSNIFQRAPIGPAQGQRMPITFVGEEFTDWCIQRGGVSKRGAKTVAKWMLNNMLFFEATASAGMKFSSSTEYCLNDEMLDVNMPKVLLQAKTVAAIEMLSKPSLHRSKDVPAASDEKADIIFTPHKKKSSDNRVHAGTVDRLVEMLTSEGRPDTEFRDAFIFTYSTFMTLEDLFMKLKSRWYLQPPTGSSDAQTRIFESTKRKPVRIRVLNALKTLIEFVPELFNDDHARLLMEEFIGTVHTTMSVVAADQLRHLMRHYVDAVPNLGDDEALPTSYENVAVMVDFELGKAAPVVLGNRPGGFKSLSGTSVEDVAKQMALVDHSLWKKLELRECLFKCWTKKVKPGEADPAPTIRLLTDRFNMIAAWVGCMVVNHVRLADRAKELARCIMLAQNLTELKDYFGAMAIMAGLNGSSVNRLYKTWEKLEGDEYAAYSTMKETYSSTGNYKNYRAVLSKTKPPSTPYIGLFLKDLVFIEDGNPDELEDGRLINFQKKMQIGAVLKQIRKLQGKYYRLAPNIALVRELVLLPSFGDTESYIRSKRLEPREPYVAIEHHNIKEDEANKKIARLEAEVEELREASKRDSAHIEQLTAALRGAGLQVPAPSAEPEEKEGEDDAGWTLARVKPRAPTLRTGASVMGLKAINAEIVSLGRKSDPVVVSPPPSRRAESQERVSSPEMLGLTGETAKKEPKAAICEEEAEAATDAAAAVSSGSVDDSDSSAGEEDVACTGGKEEGVTPDEDSALEDSANPAMAEDCDEEKTSGTDQVEEEKGEEEKEEREEREEEVDANADSPEQPTAEEDGNDAKPAAEAAGASELKEVYGSPRASDEAATAPERAISPIPSSDSLSGPVLTPDSARPSRDKTPPPPEDLAPSPPK